MIYYLIGDYIYYLFDILVDGGGNAIAYLSIPENRFQTDNKPSTPPLTMYY
jgi:hypothetical protein